MANIRTVLWLSASTSLPRRTLIGLSSYTPTNPWELLSFATEISLRGFHLEWDSTTKTMCVSPVRSYFIFLISYSLGFRKIFTKFEPHWHRRYWRPPLRWCIRLPSNAILPALLLGCALVITSLRLAPSPRSMVSSLLMVLSWMAPTSASSPNLKRSPSFPDSKSSLVPRQKTGKLLSRWLGR